MSRDRTLSPPSSPLPELWSTPETIEDVVVAGEVTIHRAGISAVAPSGEEITGSAAGTAGSPLARARFELLERVSILEAMRAPSGWFELHDESGASLGSHAHSSIFPESSEPERWRFARSNGVALHSSWSLACERAKWELAERDRILRSWHGEIAPQAMTSGAKQLPRIAGYDWCAYRIPDDAAWALGRGIEVAAVFGFPESAEQPLAFGFGARPNLDAALVVAAGEAVQSLAFLWGEPVSADDPAFEPTAMFHLETYQRPSRRETLRRWLEGAHVRHGASVPRASTGAVGFVDLTPDWLGDGLRVAKAVCEDAIPLVFGESPFTRHLPEQLRIHPVP